MERGKGWGYLKDQTDGWKEQRLQSCERGVSCSPEEAGSAGRGRSCNSHILTLPSSEHDINCLNTHQTLLYSTASQKMFWRKYRMPFIPVLLQHGVQDIGIMGDLPVRHHALHRHIINIQTTAYSCHYKLRQNLIIHKCIFSICNGMSVSKRSFTSPSELMCWMDFSIGFCWVSLTSDWLLTAGSSHTMCS